MQAIVHLKPDYRDRQLLKGVTRGVYVMQCRESPHLLRYGQIGAGGALDNEPSDKNNANKRLSQVRRTWRLEDARHAATFDFVLLCHLQQFCKRRIKKTEGAIQVAMRTKASTWGKPFMNEGCPVRRYKDGLRALAAPDDAFLLNNLSDVDSVVNMVVQSIATHIASYSCPLVFGAGR